MTNEETRAILTDEEAREIRLLADRDINIAKTATELYMHRNTLVYRLDMITLKTGLDPRKFWDLVNLLKVLGDFPYGNERTEERTEEDLLERE